MMPADRSALRCEAAKALVLVAERGDEAVKAALLERLEGDEIEYVSYFEEQVLVGFKSDLRNAVAVLFNPPEGFLSRLANLIGPMQCP
eukprot:2587601-Amphidinium_carterae.1